MALSGGIPEPLRRALRSLKPLGRAVQLWSSAGGADMSAAVSFYGILSLAPLLLAIVAILGWWMDRSLLQAAIVRELDSVIGARGTSVIADALASARHGSQGVAASVVGFVVLLSGATGVFGQLQGAFEQVWADGRGPQPKAGWRHTVTLRVRGIGYVLVFGFLLLVSLVISTLLQYLSNWGGDSVPQQLLAAVVNEVVGFLVCAALFLGLMRLSEGPKPRMRFLLLGAGVGAILFTVGRQLLSLYLANAAVVSAYGAAGSLIVLLIWIYFSSAVLLLGAACARALEEHRAERREEAAASADQERRRQERRHGERRRWRTQAPTKSLKA